MKQFIFSLFLGLAIVAVLVIPRPPPPELRDVATPEIR